MSLSRCCAMANRIPHSMPHPYRKFRIKRVRECLEKLFPGAEISFQDFEPEVEDVEIVETDLCIFTVKTDPPRKLILFEALLIRPDSQIERLLAKPELAHKLRLVKRGESVLVKGLDADSPIMIRDHRGS